MDKVREEFEKWFNSPQADMKLGQAYSLEKAIEITAFTAWQASRAALVVELPERVLVESSAVDKDYDLHDLDSYYEPNDIHAALDKAGIKYE